MFSKAYTAALFALICLIALVRLLFLNCEQVVSLLILPASIKRDKGTVLVHSRRQFLRGVPSQFTEAHLP